MILELKINTYDLLVLDVKLKFITISYNVKSSRDSLVTPYNYTQSLYKPSAFVVALQDMWLLNVDHTALCFMCCVYIVDWWGHKYCLPQNKL